MKLSLNNIIVENIRENNKLENAVFNLLKKQIKIEKYNNEGYVRWDAVIRDIQNVFSLSKEDVLFFIFKWVIKKNFEPFEYLNKELEDVISYDGAVEFLIGTGWWDKFFTLDDFGDFNEIVFEKDGNINLYVDGWVDFIDLFENPSLMEEILSEDYSELFDAWDEYFDNIWDDINDENITNILESLSSYSNELNANQLPEALEEYDNRGDINSSELISITPELINTIINNDTSQILKELIDDNSELDDLKHDIKNAYNVSYNDAAQSELFNKAKESLEELFGGKIDWCERPVGDGVVTDLCVTISKELFVNHIKEYINYYRKFPREEYFHYINMLSDVLVSLDEELKTVDLDYWYPDSDKTEKYFNEILSDYLYMSA